VSALVEPIGALIGLTGVELYPSLNAAFLSFAAGAMIFVSLHELYPMGRQLGHPNDFAVGAAPATPTYAILQFAIVHGAAGSTTSPVATRIVVALRPSASAST
jgi:ZIP family zinc transporter